MLERQQMEYVVTEHFANVLSMNILWFRRFCHLFPYYVDKNVIYVGLDFSQNIFALAAREFKHRKQGRPLIQVNKQ